MRNLFIILGLLASGSRPTTDPSADAVDAIMYKAAHQFEKNDDCAYVSWYARENCVKRLNNKL